MKTYCFKPKIYLLPKFVFLFMAIGFTSMNMEGKISFAYDAAGNRVKRELVITQKSNAPGKTASLDEKFFDSIGGKSVTLSSETSGFVHIKINDFTTKDVGHVTVYTINGINVLEQEITDSSISIDLSSKPMGVYVLCVIVNGNQTTWKITKK